MKLWNGETRVTSFELRVESLKAQVEIQKCELKFKFTSYELKSTSYEFESTRSRIIYLLFINHYYLIIISSRVQKPIKQP